MLPRRLNPDVVSAGTRRIDDISATSLYCLDADDLRATAPSPSGRTEDVGDPMTSSGSMTRGSDDVIGTNDPMCARDGPTSSPLIDVSMMPVGSDVFGRKGDLTWIEDVGADVFDREGAPTWTEGLGTDVDGSRTRRDSDSEVTDGMFPLNDEDSGLSLALLSSSSTSSECGVAISTEHLSYLTDFRVRGRSEELKHTVTNSSRMTLIAGFPSKDDHFEDRFFFVEISERTVEADCIDLVKRRWERRVKPSLPEVSKEFLTAMHTELSSRNSNWRKSFSRKRIERALSAEIFPGKILGQGQARVSFNEQAAFEAAVKANGSLGTNTPRAVAPMTSTPMAASVRVSGKGKGVDRVTPSKRQRVDTYPAAVVGRETSASHVGGLLRDEAYSAVKSRASEDSELGAAKEANAVLQSRLDEFAERNEVLECDTLCVQKIKRDCDDKLTKLKSRCTKAEGEVVQLRGELSSASDLQRSRIDDAVAETRDEMARGFAERASEVARLLADIGRKVQNDMLNLAEIDANLEVIGLLQGSEPPYLPAEVKALRERLS
ncbi:hypothetical protein AALP_AA7G137800 [Arabis alpina]|uniref:Uncharacterized protein n=1 Tax=Arabis alpina TaxID=50452 RepID=A0A087GHW7_ARAAL|nr:hypothetical protein AALP_AA7G137800 [Arabis alpina]